MKRVILESPFKGDRELNKTYARFAMRDCLLNHSETPYASHLLYTQPNVLRDEIPDERRLGIEAGFFWRDVAENTAFYVDLGITEGMGLAIDECNDKKKPYEFRSLPKELWNEFSNVCVASGISKPEKVLHGSDSGEDWE